MYAIGAVLAAALAFALVATAVDEEGARASVGESTVLTLGDRIRLDRAPVGCRVTRLAGHGRQAFVDCRRAGPLSGTYGTYFGESKVLVVRYLDAHTARVVFRARQERRAERCG
jgi:hypothetical protein